MRSSWKVNLCFVKTLKIKSVSFSLTVQFDYKERTLFKQALSNVNENYTQERFLILTDVGAWSDVKK